MSVLQSRLDQLEMARQAQSNAQHTQSLNDISWGNQIRSYVLHVCILVFPMCFLSLDIRLTFLSILSNNKKAFSWTEIIVFVKIMDSKVF